MKIPFSTRMRGFSLIEMLAAVLIISILAVYILPRISASTGEAKNSVNAFNKATINSAVERYASINGKLPDTIDDLDSPDYFPDGIPDNPVNGQPYSLDPDTKRVQEGGGGK